MQTLQVKNTIRVDVRSCLMRCIAAKNELRYIGLKISEIRLVFHPTMTTIHFWVQAVMTTKAKNYSADN